MSLCRKATWLVFVGASKYEGSVWLLA